VYGYLHSYIGTYIVNCLPEVNCFAGPVLAARAGDGARSISLVFLGETR
jgi:hypothetical protein